MKCHYEVLGVTQDSDDGTIKTAYRKLALKHHPDKNLDNPESKAIFQLIQQAYEILSDPQERAWYDRHREQILHGNQSNYEDKCLDVYQYFTTSCYDGFDDKNPRNFYKVYGDIFSEIAAEDLEYMDSPEDFESIPKFGDSKSDYETVVRPFYTHFESYSTKKSYVWLFPHNINEIRERRVLKIIDKEHKKIQQKARKERNEEVRSLVLFVKKRDKRVIEYKKLVEEKLQENRLKTQQNRLEQIKKRKQEIAEQQKKSKHLNPDHEDQLRELEKSYLNQFGDSEDEYTDEDEEDVENLENDVENLNLNEENVLENDDLYCIACDKFFTNPSSFRNHEESKKHKQNVTLLKEQMLKEESEFQTSNTNVDQVEDEEPVNKNGEEDEDFEEEHEDEAAVETPTTKKSKKSNKSKKSKKKQVISHQESEDEVEVVPELLVIDKESDHEESWNDKKGNKKAKNKKSKSKNVTAESSSQVESEISTEKPEKSSSKKSQKSQTETKAEISVDVDHVCVTCKQTFTSKNRLFNHLKDTKHSAFIDKVSAAKTGKSRKN